MADRWIGFCDRSSMADSRRALKHLDSRAQVTFAISPEDMRARINEAVSCVGAIVGPLEGPLSAINIAAALVRDGIATNVALVVPSITYDLRRRAERAGIHAVIDLRDVPMEPMDNLDEPELPDDDVPTMVVGIAPAWDFEPLRQSGSEVDNERKIGPCVIDKPVEETFVSTSPGADPAGPPLREGRSQTREPSETDTPVITFVSGRGGVGKTSLVAMMATIAARWGLRVGLCDLDLSCGNLYSCFGVPNSSDLASIVGEGKGGTIEDCRSNVGEGIALWGPCAQPEMAELVYPKTGELLAKLRELSDLVLVDTSSTFTDAVAQAAQACDRLVITVDGRSGSAVAQARVAALAVRLGVARTRIVRLANRCGPHGRGEPDINRADRGLETARPLRVLDGGPEVADCLAEGKAGELLDLGSRFAESSSTVLATLLSELGRLPNHEDAQRALQNRADKPRWSFGRRREAM